MQIRSMQYKAYASDVHMKIHTTTIRHIILISMILATDTLYTTELYDICHAIDMHAACYISTYVLKMYSEPYTTLRHY